jgi:NAD(P)-dependent dehydrogenase (short-subunit alcohol dehydrogenase family)
LDLRAELTIDLTGRRIIVTGSASGIGAGAVDLFVASGAKVAALDLQEQSAGPRANLLPLKCDVADRDAVSAAFDRAAEFLGGLDVLCHPAGLNGRGIAEDLTPDEMRQMFEVNVMGTYHTNQAAWRHMRESGGSIINFSSMAAIRGLRNEAHYAASKGAVAAWTRAVALDWGKYNIRVNAVAPVADTAMAEVALSYIPAEQRAAAKQRMNSMQALPGGLRPGAAIAPLLAFLASDASDYITGQTFSADGGVMLLGS